MAQEILPEMPVVRPEVLGREAESWIERMIGMYRDAQCATIMQLPVARAGYGERVAFKRVSPFDYIGQIRVYRRPNGLLRPWSRRMSQEPLPYAIPFAMELKRNARQKPSLGIVRSTKSGAGIAEHQLYALHDWAFSPAAAGMAMLVWINGDSVMRLTPEGIRQAVMSWEQAIGRDPTIRSANRPSPRKSIPVELFQAVDCEPEHGIIDFLAEAPFEEVFQCPNE